jgi:hypothetical protein
MNAHVRDNLQSRPIATSVTALNALYNGTPGDGAPGFIRVGSSPYEFVSLLYSATLSKWVEEDADLLVSMLLSAPTTSTAYTQIAAGPLMYHKMFTDAGLVLNVKVQALLTAGASSTCVATCLASTGPLSGALTLDTTHNTGNASTSSTSAVIADGTWTALNASITPTTYVALSIGCTRTGVNNGTVGAGTALWMRWSS